MSEESNFFICRNNNCNILTNSSGESLSGGMISEYRASSLEKKIICKHCKTEHTLIDGEVFLIYPGGELSIKSIEDYSNFKDQCEANRVLFKKLIISNLEIRNFSANEISFNRCIAGQLIIENIKIDSAYSPFSFANCTFDNVKINNISIKEIKSNNYKSLYSFFGINFFNTEVKGKTDIQSSETSLALVDSIFYKPLDISKKSHVNIATAHCEKIPEIKVDKSSTYTPFLETVGRDPSNKKKSLSSSSGNIHDLSLDELHIDADSTEPVLVENCKLDKLMIPEGKNIKAKLVFRNCLIRDIDNQANSFEQDMVFFGCQFQHQVLLSGSYLKRSLVFEFCTFDAGIVINNLDIEKEFQFNYASVSEDMLFEGNRCKGYVKTRFDIIAGILKLEDNIVARDLDFLYVKTSRHWELKYNEVGGYVFIKYADAGDGLELNMLNADSLTLADISCKKTLELQTVSLKSDLRASRLNVDGDFSMNFSRTEGIFNCTGSRITGNMLSFFFDSKVNMFVSIEVQGDMSFNSCNFDLHTWANRNLIKGSMNCQTLKTHNLSINDNRILNFLTLNVLESKEITLDNNITDNDISISNSVTEDIQLNDNICGGELEINDCETGDIGFNDNYVMKELKVFKARTGNLNINDNRLNSDLKIERSSLQDLKVYDNYIYGNLEVANGSTRDFLSGGNWVRERLLMNFLETKDVRIQNSIIDQINIFNSTYTDVLISECQYIGDTNIDGNTVQKGFKIADNYVEKEVYLQQCVIGQTLDIEYNMAKQITVGKANLKEVSIIGNNLLGGIDLSGSKTSDIGLSNNQAHEHMHLRNLESGRLDLDRNTVLNGSKFFNLKASDLNLSVNEFKNEVEIEFPNLEDLHINICKIHKLSIKNGRLQDFRLFNVKHFEECILSNLAISKDAIFRYLIGTNISIDNCITGNDITLKNSYFQQLDFNLNRSNKIFLNDCTIRKNITLFLLKANDIMISKCTISEAYVDGSIDMEKEKEEPTSLLIGKCSIDSELLINESHIPETIIINQNLADKFSFINSRTKSLKFKMGRFRKMSVTDCEEIWEFKLHNTSIEGDITIYDNTFQRDFAILNCKIGNDLALDGNTFKGYHRILTNTILGTATYNNEVFHHTMDIHLNQINYLNFSYIDLAGTFYFNNNTIHGGMVLGKPGGMEDDSIISFPEAISFLHNKIKTVSFQHIEFRSPVCMRHNNIEGDLSVKETTHHQTLDFTSSFIGGSFVFYTTSQAHQSGHLILDNAFIDKRISFDNYYPASYSFIRTTFNGFEIPDDWLMKRKQLISKHPEYKNYEKSKPAGFLRKLRGGYLPLVLRENQMRHQYYDKAELPYSIMKERYLENEPLNGLKDNWKELKERLFENDEILQKLDQTHRREDKKTDASMLRAYFKLYDQCFAEDFLCIYYMHFNESTNDAITEGALEFSRLENNYKDEEAREMVETIKPFFKLLHEVLVYFRKRSFHAEGVSRRMSKTEYNTSLFKNLEEQYSVLRHIWGDNGELKEEDTAYYKWMHFKNIAQMRTASVRGKWKYGLRYLLYEKVFGWGVDLFRIIFSTLGVVGIFTFIYYVIFLSSPELTIQWDNVLVKSGDIGFWKSFVFALQTTFSAGLGDWAPIGSGAIKIPMTINAVLGVLFVTFLIGAYGRKMLR